MSKLKSKTENTNRIKFIEDTVTDYLNEKKSIHSFTFWHLQVFPSEFNRVLRFYFPTIFITSILPLKVGDRIQLIEISNQTLQPTGRTCFRFINNLKCLPSLLTDDDWFDLELSVSEVAVD